MGELNRLVVEDFDLGQIHPSQGKLTTGMDVFLADIVSGTDQPLLIHIGLPHHIDVSILVKKQPSGCEIREACRHPPMVFHRLGTLSLGIFYASGFLNILKNFIGVGSIAQGLGQALL